MGTIKDLNNYTEKQLKHYFHSLGKKGWTNTQAFGKVQMLLRFKFGCSARYIHVYKVKDEQS